MNLLIPEFSKTNILSLIPMYMCIDTTASLSLSIIYAVMCASEYVNLKLKQDFKLPQHKFV